MNNIGFKGIYPLSLLKKSYSSEGPYLDMYNNMQRGPMKVTEIKLYTKLSDDAKGADLTDFNQRLNNKNLFNPNDSDIVELHVTKKEVPEESFETSSFKLNGRNLLLNDEDKLPIMTFLARMTRELVKNPTTCPAERKYLGIINNSIQKETMNYIENKPF